MLIRKIQNKIKHRKGNKKLLGWRRPCWSIDDDTHQATSDDTSNWEGEDPTCVTPGNHSPVESLNITVTESDTHGSSDNALGGGDWEREAGSHNDCDSGTKLHGETTGWGLESKAVTQVPHDVVTISPETNDNSSTTIGKYPDRNISLLFDSTRVPNKIDGSKWTDSVRYIVGTVSKGGSGSSKDLEEGVEMLSLVVEVSSTGVNVLNITSQSRFLGLLSDDILPDTMKEGINDNLGEVLWSIPWASILSLNSG